MMYKLIIHKSAAKYLARINEPSKSRIKRAIKNIEMNIGDIKKLTGDKGYRLRVGDYRILFNYNDSNNRINVYKIAPRGQAYKER